MALDWKLLGLNGRSSSSLGKKKAGESCFGWQWRKLQLVLLFFVATGFAWFFMVFGNSSRTMMGMVSSLTDDKVNTSLQHVYVSKEQFLALASLFLEGDQIISFSCSKKPGSETTSKCSVAWAISPPSTVNHLNETYRDSISGQCRIQDVDFVNYSEGSPLEAVDPDSTLSPVPTEHNGSRENVLETKALEDDARDHCDCTFFYCIRYSWVFFVMGMSCKIFGLFKKTLLINQHENPVLIRTLFKPHQQLLEHQAHVSSGSVNWRKNFLLVVLVVGVILSVGLFLHIYNDNNLRRKETLASMCDERARMLQDQFNASMNHVHALAILVSTFHHGKQPSAIDQKTFEEYTERTAFERPLTSGVAYALRVRHAEREIIEKLHGWTIKKMEIEDQTLAQESILENLDSSPVQDEYAPVVLSQKTVSHIVSIDMMSGKEDRENILRARASGKGVLTSPFKLLKSNHLGVVLTFAVYNTHLSPNATPQERINATVGYLGASYDVPSLVEKLLHQLASKQTIVVSVYDTTNISTPIKMYGTSEVDTGLLHVSPLDFGDPARKHEMQCRFKHKPPLPWNAIGPLCLCLVILLLGGCIFYNTIAEIAKVESDYLEMTELKHRAEAADIAKSQFLATVSHEIRTPMNGVLGMLQMLMDTNLDATQMDYAQTAHASGKDLISLINEVLDQAKIESGRLELEAVPFDLRSVLDNVLSLFSIKSQELGIELAVYVSDQVPKVVIGDPGRFRQIITNLVGNSTKFTNNSSHIFVSVHLADEVRDSLHVTDEVLRQSLPFSEDESNASCSTLSGNHVVNRSRSWENFKTLYGTIEGNDKIKLLVTVEDTGVGIPQEAQSRIFQPFMQADSSTSRTYGGTGIGLSICQRLVELMDGEIGFASKQGIGSTFSFTVTFTKSGTTSVDKKLQNPATLSEFGGLRALVVDGRRVRAEVTRYHLHRLGINVDVASTAGSASSYVSSYSRTSEPQPLSVFLIDTDTWIDNTFQTFRNQLKELRSKGLTVSSSSSMKIYLLATGLGATELNELKASGIVDNVLMKPLRLSVLVSCFQEAVGFRKKKELTKDGLATLRSLLRGRRILVVDDNVVNRRVAEGALKKYGALVTCVDSGKAAKELLAPPHDYDACFMDLQMPEMDGFEATRQIRELERKHNQKLDYGETSTDISTVAHWHTPILAMTADVIHSTNDQCVQCGMDDYISKPFEEGQLYSAVARFFESDIDNANLRRDCYIDICSQEVLRIFNENFDYQHLRGHFKDLLHDDDIMGCKIFTYEIDSRYAARIDNFRSYDTISKDIIQRWTYPVVTDVPFLGNTDTKLERRGVYKASDVGQSRSAQVGPFTVIGNGTTIGDNSKISNSVVGESCTIGSNVSIDGCYIWHNITIEDGCQLKHAIVCDGVVLKSGSMLEPGVVLSFKVIIGQNFVVPAYSKVSSLKHPASIDSDEELEYADDGSSSSSVTDKTSISDTGDRISEESKTEIPDSQLCTTCEVGSGGVGFIWSIPEGSLEEEWRYSVAPIPLEKLAEIIQSASDELEIDQDGIILPPSGELEAGSISDASSDTDDIENDHAFFEKEVEATFLRAVHENIKEKTVIGELNTLRLSLMLNYEDCITPLFYSMMKLALDTPHSSPDELRSNASSVISKWRKLLKEYVKDTDDEIEVLQTFEEMCSKSAQYSDIFVQILHLLYDQNVIQADAILRWANEKEGAEESDKIFVQDAEDFIKASEEED